MEQTNGSTPHPGFTPSPTLKLSRNDHIYCPSSIKEDPSVAIWKVLKAASRHNANYDGT